jgi:hypothetical protein
MLQKTGLLGQGKAHSWSLLVLILTLVALPKAGFLVRGIPITWGYLVVIGLGVIGFSEWLQGLRSNKSIRLSLPPLAWLIPFQTILVGTFIVLGYERPGYAASLIFSFVIMPYLMAGLANSIPLPAPAGLWLRNAVRFVLLYGMLTFLISNISGWFIELPGLTTMLGGDVPLSEKNNNRYGIYKFISTYSNGNIYGICLLMLLPIYARLEHGGFVFLAKLSIVLTLSRTAWIGLVLYDCGGLLKASFERRTRQVSQALLALGIDLVVIKLVSAFTLWGSAGVLDRNLGGRLVQFSVLDGLKERWREGDYLGILLPVKAFIRIYEMTYMGMLESFGVLGLVFFILGMGFPVYYIGAIARKSGNHWLQAVCLSMVVYLIVAFSDGALVNAPVMAFYWAMVFFSLSAYQRIQSSDQAYTRTHDAGSFKSFSEPK